MLTSDGATLELLAQSLSTRAEHMHNISPSNSTCRTENVYLHKRNAHHAQVKTYKNVHSIIAQKNKNWKLNCPSTEQINKFWYIHEHGIALGHMGDSVRLNVQLLILARVVISGLWDRAQHWAHAGRRT